MEAKELEPMIQRAITEGVTLAGCLALLICLAVAGLGAFLKTYLEKKAEAFATKEDFCELVRQAKEKAYEETKGKDQATNENFDNVLQQLVRQTEATEAIKNELTQETEALRTQLAAALEDHKAQLLQDVQFKTQVLMPRMTAYQKLWALTEPVRPSLQEEITEEQRRHLEGMLTTWYYQEGNGIFLSLEAGHKYLHAKSLLRDGAAIGFQEIKEAFSQLRTQLKSDIKVYGPADIQIDIAT